METLFPEWNRSLISVASSIMRHYNVGDVSAPTLKEADEVLSKNYRNVVLMLYDGMFPGALRAFLRPSGCLLPHMSAEISSVFPPTTTAATTSVLSGLAPFEHGWLGWDVYFPELGVSVTPFRNTIQDTDTQAADFKVADRFLPYKTIQKRIKEASPDVNTATVSPFASGTKSLKGMRKELNAILSNGKRNFVYCYWPEPDHTMHDLGTGAAKVGRKIRAIERHMAKLTGNLSDTLVMVVADHGLIDCRWSFLVTDYPEIAKMQRIKPSIESRARSFFVKSEYMEEFPKAFNAAFKDEFVLLSREEVMQKNLFGFGNENPVFKEAIGDFVAYAVSDLNLGWEYEKKPLKGHHAGMTAQEMRVPFIVFECR